MSDRDYGDRPKRSWAEIDKRRDGSQRRDDRERPRGRAAEQRSAEASQQYIKELDKLFSSEKGGAEGEALGAAVREAHGSSQLPEACRAYLAEIGMPRDPEILSLFLDSGENDLVVPALEALQTLRRDGDLEVKAGLKSQVRILAQSFDNDVAEAAEDLEALL